MIEIRIKYSVSDRSHPFHLTKGDVQRMNSQNKLVATKQTRKGHKDLKISGSK